MLLFGVCQKIAGSAAANKFARAAWLLVVMVLVCGSSSRATPPEIPPGRFLNIFTRDEGDRVHFYAQNLQLGAVTTTFELQLTNMTGSTNFPYTTTLAAGETAEMFTLAPTQKEFPCHYSYVNSAILGDAEAVHDDAIVYSLPYAPGSSFRVSQGYHGTFSHTGPDEYAIDWKMPVGTPVYAARGGLVVKAKDDSNRGGPRREFEASANCILVQHADGTLGMYGHLKQGGNRVKAGDRVRAGDLIGLSGKTGFANGPHLHFAVFKAGNGSERVTLPVKFRTADGSGLTLESGQSYKAATAELPQPEEDSVSAAAMQIDWPTGWCRWLLP
jgi:murein DD-endopeptidase MepM/ murein hydrolase activator NlpD